MQLQDIKPRNKPKRKKRVGRGGKRGTYSGKGLKGQKSRAGAKIRPELRDFIKKVPKLKGYNFKRYKKKSAKRKPIKAEKPKTKNSSKINKKKKEPSKKTTNKTKKTKN